MVLGTSSKFQINGLDIASVGRSALDGLIALVITLLPMLGGATYIVAGHDVTAGVVIILGLAVKGLRKYLTDHTATPPAPGMN